MTWGSMNRWTIPWKLRRRKQATRDSYEPHSVGEAVTPRVIGETWVRSRCKNGRFCRRGRNHVA